MEEARKLLRSWKEISAHLGVDERTCARWEQRFNLPVHRAAEGAGRSHVFAYTDELDTWFRETFPASGPQGISPGATDPQAAQVNGAVRHRHQVMAAIVTGLLLFVTFLAYQGLRGRWPFTGSGVQPVDFHIRGSTLVLVNENGKEIGHHDLQVEGLVDEAYYRRFFQVVAKNEFGEDLPYLLIKDLDGDGNKEVVFAVRRRTDSFGEGVVICFDNRANELWTFKAGRELTYGGNELSADYRIHGFVVHDANGDGLQEIYVLSYHYPWEPTQLAVLDHKGTLKGEFWNAGQLKDIVFADLDGDGKEELFAGGVNNEYKGGCLAGFDPSDIHGSSPQGPEYSFKGFAPGSEEYYVLFPRTDISLAEGSVVAGLSRLETLSNGRIRAEDHFGLPYEFGAGMRCLSLKPEHGFIMRHDAFEAAGKITSKLDDAYFGALKNGLRYWNGTAWVHDPTKNLSRGK